MLKISNIFGYLFVCELRLLWGWASSSQPC